MQILSRQVEPFNMGELLYDVAYHEIWGGKNNGKEKIQEYANQKGSNKRIFERQCKSLLAKEL